MFLRRVFTLTAGALLLAACSSDSDERAESFDTEQRLDDQVEVRSAVQWEGMAAHTAGRIAQMVKSDSAPLKDRTFYLDAPPPTSAFVKGLNQYLTTHLVARGLRLTLNRLDADYRIHYTVQVVPQRLGPKEPSYGALTLIATGLWLLESEQKRWVEGETTLTGIGSVFSAWSFAKMGFGRSFSEVHLTLSVVEDATIMARSDATYIIDRRSEDLYRMNSPAPPLVRHDPAWIDEPMPVRDFTVSSD